MAGARVVCPSAGFFLSSLRTPLPLLSFPPSYHHQVLVSAPSRSHPRFPALIACLLAIAPGVPCEELLLLLDLSLPRSCILRLSLSVSACAHHHHHHHHHPSLPRVRGAWPGCCALSLFASLRHARATPNGGGDTPIAQRRWRQQASAQSSTSTAPSSKCFIYTLGPGGSGGDRTRLKTSLSAHHRCSSAQPAAESSSHRRQLLGVATIRRNTP